MRNIAGLMSLLALVFAITSCTKGCKNQKPSTPPIEKKAPTDHKDEEIKEPEAAPPVEKKEHTEDKEKLMNELNLKPGEKLYAEFDTSMGTIKAELFWEQTPMTVRNFVELALGKKEWTGPAGKSNKPLYDGTIFHRVIKDFMIQGGDPAGNGTGGPGYQFKDEFVSSLRHDKKGVLSMANRGPNTNGSQFFITDAPTPHLDGRHTVFGQADTQSIEVIAKIASVPTDPRDKPQQDVKITKINIVKG